MRVIVAGGRNYDDYNYLSNILKQYRISVIIQGGCTGVDKLAQQYAITNNILYITYHADWDKYGKSAGAIRNHKMIVYNLDCDLVILFPGGRGTANLKKYALKYNLKILEV